MAAKRIYQIAKEFEREEKDIIEFLTGQGIKVGNRLSAVSDDTYNLLKAKFLAPPEPEPAPAPEPVAEQSAPVEQPNASSEQAPAQQQGGGKKKKKKNKNPQAQGEAGEQFEEDSAPVAATSAPAFNFGFMNEATAAVYREATEAGNIFIEDYRAGYSKKKRKALQPKLSPVSDMWNIIRDLQFDYPDASPVRYWQAVNKLSTKAFKLLQKFGLANREALAAMRKFVAPVGKPFEPREIFTEEENQLFEEQRKLLFRLFSHGMGEVNDNLYYLKMKAEHMKEQYEHMDFVEYTVNPDADLRSKDRAPFYELAEAVNYSIRGVARRFVFYMKNTERLENVLKNFFEWIDGYAKLKEEGADTAKLEKYLDLEKKFISMVEFMSFDNLIPRKKLVPFDIILDLLNNYRDNLDDPDAERNFKYKVRGVTNLLHKPKEYVFTYQFADLEPQKDYRPPEEIAAAEAKAAAEAEAQAKAAAEAAAAEDE